MLVFGSSGHAREITWFHSKYGHKDDILFYVSNETGVLNGKQIINDKDLEKYLLSIDSKVNGVIAIGNGLIRKKIVDKFAKFAKYGSLYYPNLIFGNISEFSSIGLGNIFFPTFCSTVGASIGSHNHFNLKSSISHDVEMGDYNTLSPNVTLAGGVRIGDNVFFGVGALVIDNITICSDVVIGAGAVVVNHIRQPGTYVGVPAKRIK